jgi:hypothetical protein
MLYTIAMGKYFNTADLAEMNLVRERIFAERTSIYQKYKIDILDTDALSALAIYQIVSQYDSDYNINFSRNNEDAKSKDILIEQKASRVDGPYTKTGKLRKNAGYDAVFQFHAMGDIEHRRYIFVSRNKEDLSLMRLYDIQETNNVEKVTNHLLNERNLWLERTKGDSKLMKRDIITISEKYIRENLSFPLTKNIDGCEVFIDTGINT